MRTALILLLIPALFGCGIGAPIVRSDSISYDEVIEDTTNQLLLANVLRARDKAPLHFAELPKISETVKAGASLSAKVGSEYFRSPGLSYEVDPSFDLSHVTGKDFATGIASPIDPKFVKYWHDRGLDQRLLLFLFFSSADIIEERKDATGSTVRRVTHIANSPRGAIDREPELLSEAKSGHSPCPKSEFARYLRLLNNLELIEIPGPPSAQASITVDFDGKHRPDRLLSALASFDSSKYKVSCDDTKCYVKPAGADGASICYKSHWHKLPVGAQCSSTSKTISTAQKGERKTQKEEESVNVKHLSYVSERAEYCRLYYLFAPEQENQHEDGQPLDENVWMELSIRSVGELIQYLGDLLAIQDYLAEQQEAHNKMIINSPLTFGFCSGSEKFERARGCADYVFRVNSGEHDTRFSMKYRGQTYSIAPYASSTRPLVADFPVRDHSLEVLAVLNQLIALNREAKDIVSTPTVRVLP